MEANSTPSNTNYQQVTVDVPEDRVAEFHAFFARFLEGRGRRGRGHRGHRHGHGHGHGHGRRCGERSERSEQAETAGQPTEITEV
ncbi:MAG TPA: hypothetical protein VGF93_06150 [Solirubrobacteraceae bacterium]|jgi:hypothetical protein